ncbi:MAG: hypothetical protein RLZZ148_3067, partial [Cyanobacteriota bacterium]
MLHHSAINYQIPLIYINQVGSNDDLVFDGHSVAFNRKGEAIYRAQGFTTMREIIEYEPNQKDLLHSKLNPLAETEEEEIFSALVLGVRDYAQKCGFSQAIIGLSGGIDSALVAVIATQALGKE